jgi:hypothetical protein
MSIAAEFRRKVEEQQQPQTPQMVVKFLSQRNSGSLWLYPTRTGSQFVRAPNICSLSLNKILKVAVMIVEQIMTESNGAVLEEAKYWPLQKLS